ncbi:unnamed protein product [Brugia pahangi]|uniref:Uncharacterized protein n=1 Tax=Brugia pahangi TaxID=6280 RepID=A0A0N4T2I2_BRUPA|nr:unnamed protein product [Brugia pahangi]
MITVTAQQQSRIIGCVIPQTDSNDVMRGGYFPLKLSFTTLQPFPRSLTWWHTFHNDIDDVCVYDVIALRACQADTCTMIIVQCHREKTQNQPLVILYHQEIVSDSALISTVFISISLAHSHRGPG